MKLKKRKKSRKKRGTRLHGHAMKKHKGKGNKGGKGLAGTGKRGDQKKTLILNKNKNYFGKPSMKPKKKNLKEINLEDIEKNFQTFVNKGEVNLEGYKVLGKGEIKSKLIIKADKFSLKAREKIEKAGGKAIEPKKEEISIKKGEDKGSEED